MIPTVLGRHLCIVRIPLLQSSTAVPWQLGDTLKGVAAVVLGGAGVLVLAVAFKGAGITSGTGASILAGVLLEIVLILVAWSFSVRLYQCSFETLGFRSAKGYNFWVISFIALSASLFVGGIYTVIVTNIGVDILQPPDLADRFEKPEGMSGLVLAFVIVVMAPVAEETFFRGFVLQGLSPWMGPIGATIGSSILFSLSHGSVGMLIPVFLSGLILAWVFMKTKSLTPGIFAHSMQNSLAFAIAF